MWIEFKDGVTEYKNGSYHRVNDGNPFECDARFAKETLLQSGSFQEASQAKQVEKVDTKKTKTERKK